MKFDAAIENIILEGVRQCLPYEVIAWKAKVHETTFYDWLKKGKKELEEDCTNGRFRTFYENFKAAEAEVIAKHAVIWVNGGRGWAAKASFMSKRWRRFFGEDESIIKELEERIAKLETINAK